jgi:hypothetical protein
MSAIVEELTTTKKVLRIRIRIKRIHMFLGLLNTDPLVRDVDQDSTPDPYIIKQK